MRQVRLDTLLPGDRFYLGPEGREPWMMVKPSYPPGTSLCLIYPDEKNRGPTSPMLSLTTWASRLVWVRVPR